MGNIKAWLRENCSYIFKFLAYWNLRICRWRVRRLSRTDLKKAVELCYGNWRKINWDNPQNINDKLQILKLGEYYNNPVITECCDKVRVKDYVERKHIPCKCAKTYAVYSKAEDIEWDKLPNRFVIKCNHGCGYNILCESKEQLDKKKTIKQLKKWLKEDFWTKTAEPQYKFIEKKILIEEYLGKDVEAYKFYCFHGIPRVMYISSKGEDGEQDKYLDFYDMDLNWLDITLSGHEYKKGKAAKPAIWEELKETAMRFAEDFPFVRVDLYDIKGEVYLSELTFVPTGGYMDLKPERVLNEWGSWLG